MKYYLLAICITTSYCFSQKLSRRADWQAKFQMNANGPGAILNSLQEGGTLDQAGLQKGDLLLEVNDRKILTYEDWDAITYSIRSGLPTKVLYRRENEINQLSLLLQPLGLESHVDIETYYEEVTSDYGITQRAIITRPKGVRGKQPAIMLIQGLSCSTIEKYSGRGGNWVNQINYLVEKSNMVVMRVDKPGVGDSEGDCGETDFITELEGYKAAIRLLKNKSYVDTTKIIVYGASMGSALAPLLANEFNLAGVISDGTFFKTWFEHMLEIERRIRQMSGDDESTIVRKMNEGYIPLYYGMLIEMKTYADVVAETPSLRSYNYHGPMHMYGRLTKYYHQLQQFNLAGEWEKVKVPIRIMYGSNDWIMSAFDNQMIMDVLDRAGHKDHELMVYPGLDHWNTIHKSPGDSFHGKPGTWDEKVPQQIVRWAKEMVKE